MALPLNSILTWNFLIIFRRIQHILVKPVTDWGYLQLNSSAPLPDSLLINIKTPPDPEIVGSSHKG